MKRSTRLGIGGRSAKRSITEHQDLFAFGRCDPMRPRHSLTCVQYSRDRTSHSQHAWALASCASLQRAVRAPRAHAYQLKARD